MKTKGTEDIQTVTTRDKIARFLEDHNALWFSASAVEINIGGINPHTTRKILYQLKEKDILDYKKRCYQWRGYNQ